MARAQAAAPNQLTLDDLSVEDPIVRNLARALRDGPGMSLHDAEVELSAFADPGKVRAAGERIREVIQNIHTAQTPRAIVAGNIETWYCGPRAEDPNWPSLLSTLAAQGWAENSLADLDTSSTKVVAYIPNPHGLGEFHCRGLVLGYVQSGKTSNFTAVIAKAADAGYRFFIVLSGIHDALRQQTQDRLNEQLWQPHPDLWNRLTDQEDFRATANVDALLANRNQRVLTIIKKNGPRLRALKRWLAGARPELLAACPILIIDDEADQASVNTAKPDRQPSRINGLIRDIVNAAPRAAYVGYTATPFANVLIDARDYSDLYPRDFIVDLPRPDVYIGPEAVFGREPLEFDADGKADDGDDLVRTVPMNEVDELRPKGSATRHLFSPAITPSLDEALSYFLLSTAARRVRGKGNRHATALVHTSQHIDVHERTAAAITEYLRSVAQRLVDREPALMSRLESMWLDEADRVPSERFGLDPVPWPDVAAALPGAASDARVITDNSRSTERLSFDEANPQVIIAVGGNTLSRGLTLEGLSVSFFVRTASAYDTLLQMGRWFGYRNGYADLTRIWMTDEMREWFHHLATVEQEIRFDIERYESEHITPEELGVRIRTHPKLAITAAAKMQHGRHAEASYSGRRLQTILFNHLDHQWLQQNVAAAEDLIRSASRSTSRLPRNGITVLGPLDSRLILEFLKRYVFHENSRDLNGPLITKYIENRRRDGELTHFTLAIMGHPSKSDLGEIDLGLPDAVNCINRARMSAVGGATYADIKSLMSQSDRVVDLDVGNEELASMTAGQKVALRNLPSEGGRGDGSGLLLLYPVSKNSVPQRGLGTKGGRVREPLSAAEHVIGVGMVFPVTRSRSAEVDYVTSNVTLLTSDVEAVDDSDSVDESEGDIQ